MLSRFFDNDFRLQVVICFALFGCYPRLFSRLQLLSVLCWGESHLCGAFNSQQESEGCSLVWGVREDGGGLVMFSGRVLAATSGLSYNSTVTSGLSNEDGNLQDKPPTTVMSSPKLTLKNAVLGAFAADLENAADICWLLHQAKVFR